VSIQIENLVKQYLSDKIDNVQEIFFCNFTRVQGQDEKRLYEFQSDYQRLVGVVSDVMKEESEIQLVLFKDAIKHLLRICRITNISKGHMVVVGVGGSGKRSLCALATLLSKAVLIKIQVTNRYSQKEFRLNLFDIIMKAGCEKKHILFVLSDKDIIMESQLEDLNQLINNGEINGLIGRDEIDKINLSLGELSRKFGTTPMELFQE